MVAVVGAGLAARVIDLFDAPLDFHPIRQLHSFEIARGMYYSAVQDAPAWQKAVAAQGWADKGLIEPPIMETVTASLYHLVGHEALWLPRLLSICFWMVGGLALSAAAKRVLGAAGAVVGLGFFLFLPYGVTASRSFMPDPLMVALMSGALWCAIAFVTSDHPERWVLPAGLTTGVALLVKPLAAFMLGPFWAVLVLAFFGRATLRSRHTWLIATLALLPTLVFLAHSLTVERGAAAQLQYRFFPEKWATVEFYRAWASMIDRAVGLEWLALAGVGLLTVPHPAIRKALFGWVAGYLAMGFVLSHHTSTHDYYSLPLIPVVAVGMGGLSAAAWKQLEKGPLRLRLAAVLIAAATAAVALQGAVSGLLSTRYSDQLPRWQELGSLFAPEDQITGLLPDYGHPFRFFGWRMYRWWPDTVEREIMGVSPAEFPAYWRESTSDMDYFVVTEFWQLDLQPDVRDHLNLHCRLVHDTESYRVFSLGSPTCRDP